MNKIDEIQKSVDIVEIIQEYVELTKKGKNYWGICPFHDDSNPSMSVSIEKQLYNCFSCNNAGGVFKFIQQIEKVSFKEAVNIVGKKVGLSIKIDDEIKNYDKNQNILINALNDAMDYYIISIETNEGKEALEYAQKRGLTPKIREKFKIGYANKSGTLTNFLVDKKKYDVASLMNASLTTSKEKDFFKNRLIFGIQNEYGDIVAFSGRSINNQEPKYINSFETTLFKKNKILYNWFNAKFLAQKNKELIIVEGFMDVIALYKSGIENVVAIMGTALTKKNIDKLNNINIILMLDSDNAGKRATIKSIKLLLENNIKCFVVDQENLKDADEILKNSGKEKLINLTNKRITGLEYIYKLHQKKFNAKSLNEIEQMIGSFKKYLVYGSQLEKDFFGNQISKEYKISKEIVLSGILEPKINLNILNPFSHETKEISKHKFNFNKHIFILIKSLLNSKEMCLEYKKKQSKIKFENKEFQNICNSIKQAKLNDSKIQDKFKSKILKIQEDSKIEIINSIEDFDDLVEKINNTYKIILKKKSKRKFENVKIGKVN